MKKIINLKLNQQAGINMFPATDFTSFIVFNNSHNFLYTVIYSSSQDGE